MLSPRTEKLAAATAATAGRGSKVLLGEVGVGTAPKGRISSQGQSSINTNNGKAYIGSGDGGGIEGGRKGNNGVTAHQPTGSNGDVRGGGVLGGGSNRPIPDRRRAWSGDERDEAGCVSEDSGTGRGVARSSGGFAPNLPPDAFPDKAIVLEGCKLCGRRFNPEALERHARACQSVFVAKRKVRGRMFECGWCFFEVAWLSLAREKKY